jgi:hypothetical protein
LTKTKNILYTTITTIAVLALLTSPLDAGIQSHMAQATTQQIPGPSIPSTPEFTQDQMNMFMANALNVSGIKTWSDKWQFGWTDFTGTTTPVAKWTHMQLHLTLPPNVTAPKVCDIGWDAVVDIDLSTGKITAADFPTMATQCHRAGVILQDPEVAKQNAIPSYIPTAAATLVLHGYSAATQDDILNLSNSLQGSIADVLTPTFSGTYSHLNGYVGQLVNERFSSTPGANYLQAGWVIAGSGGCSSSCGDLVTTNSKVIVWADSSVSPNNNAAHVFGYPSQIPAWVNGQTETAEVLCNGGSNYKEQIVYGSSLLAHVSNVACTSSAQGSEITNSVFFENGNTGSSSTWSGDITSTVQAKNANEKLNGSWNTWQSSSDKDLTCQPAVVNPSTAMTGNIKLSGTATWSTLSNVPPAC